MKNYLVWIGLALLITLPATAEDAGGTLTDAERAELIELLETSRSATEELTARATCENWAKKPAEDRWSVVEVLEHVVLTEEGLFATAQGALESPEDPEWETMAGAQVSDMINRIQDRSQKFQAPEPFEPKGGMERTELLERYGAVRAVTMDFVRSTQAPVKRHTATGPPGKMNVQQWMALIAGHNLRHNAQITEVLEQVGGC